MLCMNRLDSTYVGLNLEYIKAPRILLVQILKIHFGKSVSKYVARK
jgi:hypothetical protein